VHGLDSHGLVEVYLIKFISLGLPLEIQVSNLVNELPQLVCLASRVELFPEGIQEPHSLVLVGTGGQLCQLGSLQ